MQMSSENAAPSIRCHDDVAKDRPWTKTSPFFRWYFRLIVTDWSGMFYKSMVWKIIENDSIGSDWGNSIISMGKWRFEKMRLFRLERATFPPCMLQPWQPFRFHFGSLSTRDSKLIEMILSTFFTRAWYEILFTIRMSTSIPKIPLFECRNRVLKRPSVC